MGGLFNKLEGAKRRFPLAADEGTLDPRDCSLALSAANSLRSSEKIS